MARRKKFYNIAPLLKTKAPYMILLGMRANGKSYQAKLTVLERAWKNKEKFVYLRRWREDIKMAAVESYFGDMDVEKITGGEYNGVTAYQGFLYWALYDEEGKATRGSRIGRYCALNEALRYKSQTFVGYTTIIYEEFITDEVYLSEEPTKLQQFVSTVARLDSITVLLIGNTMSRVCPYFRDWSLQGTLRQKPGTIEVYHKHEGEAVIDIAVENCEVLERENTLFFGNAKKQIISGEWDVKESPRLPKKPDKYDECYRIDVKFSLMSFHLTLLIDDTGEVLLYIFPAKKHDKDARIVTDDFIPSPNVSRHLRSNSRAEAKMVECYRQNKVCYSDNLTAADFNNINKQYKIL